jgi:hypothetical protein
MNEGKNVQETISEMNLSLDSSLSKIKHVRWERFSLYYQIILITDRSDG